MYFRFPTFLLMAVVSCSDGFTPVTNSHSPPVANRRLSLSKSTVRASATKDIEAATSDSLPHLVFPGGGIFFYWQAGAITYLRERGYDLSQTTLAGASAGALTATLTATDVDFKEATRLALDLAEKAGVWDRTGGLQGVWGPMIYTWLDELLPDDAVDIVNDRLTLLVTPVPSFGKSKISRFSTKRDLIECNMASVHLPWFLDGKLTSNFRQTSHIDGSFLSKPEDYQLSKNTEMGNIVNIDWTEDPIMNEKANEWVKLISKDGIWDMVETGKAYAKKMEERGDFDCIPIL